MIGDATSVEGLPWRATGRLSGRLHGTAKMARSFPNGERNLILAYRPGWQAIADLRAIAHHIREIDPRITTFVLPHTRFATLSRHAARNRPTLVVSPGQLVKFKPARGKVYQGRPMPKMEQLERLTHAGVPVPRTVVLTPELRLDPKEWGEFVIVKPADLATSSHGLGIQLIRTRRVRYRPPAAFPEGHPAHVGPLLVQQFINTGRRISACRVLTLFGEPLYAMQDADPDGDVDLSGEDAQIERTVIATQAIRKSLGRLLLSDPDILALARAADAAIPEVPLKGCDILREEATGKLYVLELNCGGNTWHVSSRQQAAERVVNGPQFERDRHLQFDAFRTAARVLAARTNAEAE